MTPTPPPNSPPGGNSPDRPQLHIWDGEREEVPFGTLEADDGDWELVLLVERIEADLVRGRISFRREDLRHDTAPVLVEDTEDAVLRRAEELTGSMLRQFLVSARG